MNDDELHQKLTSEMGTVNWRELERHFARGVLIAVAPELDLAEVAVCVAKDDAASISLWMVNGRVARATDDHAKRWATPPRLFSAVVVAPWVLVQETRIH